MTPERLAALEAEAARLEAEEDSPAIDDGRLARAGRRFQRAFQPRASSTRGAAARRPTWPSSAAPRRSARRPCPS